MVEIRIQGGSYENVFTAPRLDADKERWAAFWAAVKTAVSHAAQLDALERGNRERRDKAKH